MAILSTYLSETSFSADGDQTVIFSLGRAVRGNNGEDGFSYGTISGSNYANSITTVDLYTVDGELTDNLVDTLVGIVDITTGSLPDHDHSEHGYGGFISLSGVGDHATLANLDYSSSNHTGFATTIHQHSESDITDLDDYATNTQLATTSGDIVDQIPTDLDDLYYTKTLLDGGQLDNRYYTEAEIDYIVTHSIGTTTFSGLLDTPSVYDEGKFARSTTSGVEWAELVLTEDGRQAIGNDTDIVIVNFSEAQDDTNYAVTLGVENQVDADPLHFGYTITNTTVSGLVVELSGNTNSANYVLNWRVRSLGGIGSGGTYNHAELGNLTYANSGHTGFSESGHDHSGTYSPTGHAHVEADITDLDHNATKLQSKTVPTANVGDDGKYLQYDHGGSQYVLVSGTGAAGSGETNTASNQGAGTGVFAQKLGVDLQFKSVVGGANITITNDADTITISGASGAMASHGNEYHDVGFITATLTEDLVMNSNNIDHGNILTVNGTYEGEIITVHVDDFLVNFSDVLYQAADFNYDRADADNPISSNVYCIAVEPGDGDNKVLLRGQICNTSWNWGAGDVYLHTVTGEMSQIKPSGAGDQVVICGWALSPNTIFFAPNLMQIGR